MENLSNFDLGPLTWVKTEIDNALVAGVAALDGWNGEDTVPLREAATYLHQVSGALQIVDLQGVYQLNNAIEGLLADMQAKPELRDQASLQIVLSAVKGLRDYLDGLMAGGQNNELLLAPAYMEVQDRRGTEASPSDLFRPDLGMRARRSGAELPLDDHGLARNAKAARSKYQKGLLHYLRDPNDPSGPRLMDEAMAEMEGLAPSGAQYTFWWAARGLFEAMIANRLTPDVWFKRLLGRLDLQMRRLAEGSRQLADRLFRDLLYVVSQDSVDAGRSAEVRELFELERYRPPEAAPLDQQAVDSLRPGLAALRDAINAAKEQWLRLCSGRQESLEPLRVAAQQITDSVHRLPDGPLPPLADAVRDVAGSTAGSQDAAQNEALQLEMASALLLLQHAADNYLKLGRDFAGLADVQAGRLRAAAAGEAAATQEGEVQLLDEIARQAQEKLLLVQVSHEIQANLHQVEEVLDKFFRNHRERGALPTVPGLLKQIQGAFNMLQLDVAAELVSATLERVSQISEPGQEIVADELDWIAEAISTLGLYVEALRNGRDDPAGLRALLAPPEQAGPTEGSVEEDLEQSTARLRESYGQLAVASADQTEIRGEIKEVLSRIARDADLVGDASLRGQASQAIRLLDEGASTEAIQTAVQELSGASAPVAEPEPVTTSEQETDAELFQIYIEEAKEVLDTVAGNLVRLRDSALDHDAFVEIRRGFHTLKGSGRMVGLTDPAEVAWEVEQTLNLWLRDERSVNRAVLDFVEMAADAFRGWVAELEAKGSVQVEPDAIVTVARQLRGEVEQPAAVEVPVEPPVAEAPVAVPEEAAAETIEIGEHAIPAPLFAIFADEATQRVADLRNQLAEMAELGGEQAWEGFARAAHTLAGIARTTGLAPLADAAHAVENWALAWPVRGRPLPAALAEVVAVTLEQVADQLQQVMDHHWPAALADLAERLAALQPEAPQAPAEALAPEVAEYGEPEIIQPVVPEAVEPSVPELVEPAVLEVAEPVVPEVVEPAVPEVAEPTVPEVVEPAVPEAVEPAVPELIELLAPEVVEPVAPEVAEPVIPEVVAPPAVEPVAPVAPAVETIPVAEAVAEECDPELLPIFLAEADELLPRIGESLRQWRSNPADRENCQALQRALHTLKGSARMAGAMALGDNAHDMETQIVDLGDAEPASAFLDRLEHRYDVIADQIDRLRPSEAVAEAEATGAAAEAPVVPLAERAAGMRQAFRARADTLDDLINEAGEVSIARSRVEAALYHYKQTAQELTANVERLRSQLRELELQAETQIGTRLSRLEEGHFDPLEFDRFTRLQELTRLMAESVNDVSTAQENLLGGLTDVEHALLQQSRTTRSLQQGLMTIRMVRLSSQAERLHRIVRQAARELGRNARLHIDGGDIELDRIVLDKAMAPFEHLLRNAVAHGIESPERRQAAGKPEYGEIRLVARQEGNDAVLTLSDDGAGLNLDKVRARAEALGWVGPNETVERERLESFLFMPGFSTADAVTQVAGRGVGLDVVRSEIASVGGRVRIDSELGRGTRFTIRLPVTLALAQVVLAAAGDQVYAIPAGMVVLVREMRDEEWHQVTVAAQVELNDRVFPLHSLAELTGQQPAPAEGRHRTVLLLQSGEERVALRVDALKGNTEAVLKAIGPQLSRAPGVAGATILADGRVSLIINPFALVEQAPARAMAVAGEEMAEERPPLVLVVDDSLTVRKITGRLLHREGYRVATAKDGIEALEALQDELPAVMLLDIEMPRMDGFEVARNVRADSHTRDLPIIMITSRTAEKHHAHAVELGVNEYMGKPYREEELLTAIAGFAGRRPRA